VSTSTLTAAATAVLALVFGIVGLVVVVAGSASSTASSPVLATAAIPIAGLVPVLDQAGSLCPGISAPLLAAQIDAESGWNSSANL